MLVTAPRGQSAQGMCEACLGGDGHLSKCITMSLLHQGIVHMIVTLLIFPVLHPGIAVGLQELDAWWG